jgi:hypothetical protein
MYEERRKGRMLDALENIARELERLRLLREYELGVRIEYEGGDLQVRSVEEK